jgi:hypothetical protein
MGTVSGTTTISTHETNNGFSNTSFVMSGTADVRVTSVSSGYTGASGGANVFFTNNGTSNFLISGINTSNLNGISLSFGCSKSTTVSTGNDFLVEVSSDGTNFSALSFSAFPTGTGTAIWRLVNASGNIPSVQNLRIRFRTTSLTTQYRIDDIKLNASAVVLTCESGITTNGGLNYICQEQSLQLTASSGASYLWSTGATTQSISVNAPGTYSVQVTNAQNCVSNASVTVSQAPVISIGITSSVLDATLCASGGNAATALTATINSTISNLTYVWQYENSPSSYLNIVNSGGTGSGIFTDVQNASPSISRNYRIKVVDPAFPTCYYYGTQLVTVIPDPVIQLTATNPSCSDSNDGTISAIISGGTQNNTYTYNWSPSLGNNSSVSNLSAGNYSLTVTGANGCNASSSINLVAPTALAATYSADQISCFGGTASVAISANGGTAPYSGTGNYSLTSGTYNYTVLDANGCSTNLGFFLDQPSEINLTASDDVTVYSGYDLLSCTLLQAIASGGTGSLQYSWSTEESGSEINVCPTSSTTYTVTATDANGCETSEVINVCVTDVTCFAGNSDNQKVEICHNGNSLCVSPRAVADHLAHGCTLGSCNETNLCNTNSRQITLSHSKDTNFDLFPNPTNGTLNLNYPYAGDPVNFEIKNTLGSLLLKGVILSETIQINLGSFEPGIYFISIEGENPKTIIKN